MHVRKQPDKVFAFLTDCTGLSGVLDLEAKDNVDLRLQNRINIVKDPSKILYDSDDM